MSASFASAMMNAREERLALISASLASRDFMDQASDEDPMNQTGN